jgi:hypothetical protein
MDDLPTLLRDLGLERYAAVFAENDVDFEALHLVTDAELEKLGVSLGHRKKLLKAIAALNADPPIAGAPPQRFEQSQRPKQPVLPPPSAGSSPFYFATLWARPSWQPSSTQNNCVISCRRTGRVVKSSHATKATSLNT